MNKMKAGDILLFKGEDGLSKIITWGTGSEYSHVAVCVAPEMNLAIESIAGGGVRARDIREIMEEYDVFRVKEEINYNLPGTISYLVSKLNNKYDFLGVIFLGLLKVLAKIGKPLKKATNKWQRDKDYFCSELCYEAFYHGGEVDIVPEVPEADITSPKDIAESSVVERIESKQKDKSNHIDKGTAYILWEGVKAIGRWVRSAWRFFGRSLIVAALSIWFLHFIYVDYNIIDTLKKTDLYLQYAYSHKYRGAKDEPGNESKIIVEDVPIKVNVGEKKRFWFGVGNKNIKSLKDGFLTLVFPSEVNVEIVEEAENKYKKKKWTAYKNGEEYFYNFNQSIHNGAVAETKALDLTVSVEGEHIIKYYILGEDIHRKDKQFILKAAQKPKES